MDRGRSTKAGKSLLRKTTMKGEFAKKFKRFILKKRKEKKKEESRFGRGKRKVVSANGVV